MTEVIMPKMGDGMEEGTLLEWSVKDGDAVKSGQVIGQIQTDKSILDLEAPGSGTFTGVLVGPDETVPVGVAIAAILKAGESLPAGWGGGAATGGTAKTADAPASNLVAATAPIETQQAATADPTTSNAASTEFGVAAEQPTAATGKTTEDSARASAGLAASLVPVALTVNDGRVVASPLARKIARELGVDLATVAGSGPGGRIVEKDVTAAASAPKAAPAPVAAPVAVAPTGEDSVVKLNRTRQITGQRTQESKQQAPHFYVTVEVDVEKIMALRELFEEEESGKVSINDFVVKASALALRDMPEVNAVFSGKELVLKGEVNVGIAVALPEGLSVPVTKNTDRMSLRQISSRVKELAKKAKDNKLAPDEMQGSTFAISNMGMLDVDNFLAIINLPNSAILAIASVRKKVVANENDEIEVRRRMNITCSFDHRVLDGAGGARFINVVKTYLENPTRLLS